MIKLTFNLILVLSLALPGMSLARQNPEVQQFVDKMVEKHQFDRQELTRLMSYAQKRHDILEKISRPAERVLTWGEYRALL